MVMNFLVHIHALTVAIAVSYLTLLVADASAAQGLCLWPYAIVMVILTAACLVTERHHSGR